jgi:hypothetical protein
VVDFDCDADFIGKDLKFAFPQAHTRAIASAAIRGDNKTFGLEVKMMDDFHPPAADGV